MFKVLITQVFDEDRINSASIRNLLYLPTSFSKLT